MKNIRITPLANEQLKTVKKKEKVKSKSDVIALLFVCWLEVNKEK